MAWPILIEMAIWMLSSSMEEPYKLYRNQSSSFSSITIRLLGRKGNEWGIGSTVRVTTDLGSHWRNVSSSQGYASSNSPILHFGLGKAKQIKEIEITWPLRDSNL